MADGHPPNREPVGRRAVPHPAGHRSRARPPSRRPTRSTSTSAPTSEMARQDRVHGAEGVIPTPLWMVVLASAPRSCSPTCCSSPTAASGRVTQAMLMGSVAVVVTSLLLLLWFLDNPFHGGVGVAETGRDGADARPARAAGATWSAASRTRATHRVSRVADRRRAEVIATVLLAAAAVGTAWATYQAAHWRSEQAAAGNRSTAARVQANRAAALANRQVQVQVETFIQWVNARAAGDTELATFYRQRFRPEFRPAVRGLARDPAVHGRRCPVHAVRHAPVALGGGGAGGCRSRRRAPRSRKVASGFLERADRYTLCVVLFALTLFFAGLSIAAAVAPRAGRARRARLCRVPRRGDLGGHLPGERCPLT